jgi:hypothetical protein
MSINPTSSSTYPKTVSALREAGGDLRMRAAAEAALELTKDIACPNFVIPDIQITHDSIMTENLELYGPTYINLLKVRLRLIKVREACSLAAAHLGLDPNHFEDVLARTKFKVGNCQELTGLLLSHLAKDFPGAGILELKNPEDPKETHGFILITDSKEKLQEAYTKVAQPSQELPLTTLLEELPTSYLIDPFLQYHGPAADYPTSPIAQYNTHFGISVVNFIQITPSPERLEMIKHCSSLIYAIGQQMIHAIDMTEDPIAAFLSEHGVDIRTI